MSTIRYRNLDSLKSFGELQRASPTDLPALLERDAGRRVEQYTAPIVDGMHYNFAAKAVDDTIVELLHRLAHEAQLLEKYRATVNGEIINTGEQRMVLHHLTRGEIGPDVNLNGRSLLRFYRDQHQRAFAFAEKVHTGEIVGSTGKQFDTVVQIGIGGSDLGPRAVFYALQNYVLHDHGEQPLQARFISNVDPDDAAGVLAGIDPETTLFVLVSKSGTTQETLTNEAFVLDALEQTGVSGLHPRKHIVAVTSETSPLARSSEYLDAFYIDDYIGGRYSSTSPVGSVVLSLAFGPSVVGRFLVGAHRADLAALENPVERNAAVLDALTGVYERNVLGYSATAVLPYSQALSRFPAHLQQLDMESNGKRVNRFGEPVAYATGPLVFGEPGTNGQHSFYQLLHQGTDIVPMQFIGFRRSQLQQDLEFEGSSSQRKLNANLIAQIVAFAIGQYNEDANKAFPGGRPSSLIYAERLTPEVLGALLSHYENKVMFQGFAWNINSFDQEGVQLGKVLTKQILAEDGSAPPAITALRKLLGV